MPSEKPTIPSHGNTEHEAASPPKLSKGAQRASARRTHRACDRCRVKKSKCNGQQPCNTCKANERTCVFSALRRRDIRKWHCHMQDTVDEAIQRLYRACKQSASFPGVLPMEIDGHVTTASILHGMGFTNLDLGPKANEIHQANPLHIIPVHNYSNGVLIDSPVSSMPDSPGDNPMTYTTSNNSSNLTDSMALMGTHQLPLDYKTSPTLNRHYHQQSPSQLASDQFRASTDGQLRQPYHHHYWQTPQPYYVVHPQEQFARPSPQQYHGYDPNVGLTFVTTPDMEGSHFSPDHGERYTMAATCKYPDKSSVNPRQIWVGHDEFLTVSR